MARKIKIIFVDTFTGPVPTLGLGYLAGALRKEFGDDEIEIKILQKKFENNLLKLIISEKPDIIGYISFTTPGMNYLVNLIKEVAGQNTSVIQIMGGPHITALPKSLLPEVRVGAIGAGEKTICHLVKIYQEKRDLSAEDLKKVPGIVFRDNNGELIMTGRADFYDDFDEVPKPAWDLLNIKGFFPRTMGAFPLKFYRASSIMTSRGCPFSCIFCQEKVFNKYRHHSAKRVLEEIGELIEKYDVNFFDIRDDQFAADVKRLEDIVLGIEDKGFNKRAAFYCYLRADQVSDRVLVLMKRMNMVIVFIGFESGSDRILKYLKQQNCSVEINQRAYDLCKKHGIFVYGSFIFGSPPETMADMEKTYDFIGRNRMAVVTVQTLVTYPGTEIWDYALKRGLVSEEMDWDNLSLKVRGEDRDKPWLCENVSREEFYRFFKSKIDPIAWHYGQTVKNFSFLDLLRPDFFRFFVKQPKFYLSIFKHTILDLITKNE